MIQMLVTGGDDSDFCMRSADASGCTVLSCGRLSKLQEATRKIRDGNLDFHPG